MGRRGLENRRKRRRSVARRNGKIEEKKNRHRQSFFFFFFYKRIHRKNVVSMYTLRMVIVTRRSCFLRIIRRVLFLILIFLSSVYITQLIVCTFIVSNISCITANSWGGQY